VFNYRTFRNTDPPRLVELWNALSLGRGAVILRNSTILERYVFSKPFFDPNGLFLAEENGRLIGYAHAGGCQAADGSEVQGVVSAIGVLPSHRRRGVDGHPHRPWAGRGPRSGPVPLPGAPGDPDARRF